MAEFIYPDAIITGDMHLRDTTPVCRTDDYFAAQAKKIKFIYDLQYKYNCTILDSGDLFHVAKSSNFLVGWAILNLPSYIITTPGNHDLPNHNIELINHSSLHTLLATKVLKSPLYQKDKIRCVGSNTNYVTSIAEITNHILHVYGLPWGGDIKEIEDPEKDAVFFKSMGVPHNYHEQQIHRTVLIAHKLLHSKETPDWDKDGSTAFSFLKKMKNYDLIVTGDNHKPFVKKLKSGRLLVNPGSMMRMTSDQYKHKPRIYLYYAKTNTVKKVYLPIEEGVVNREHINKESEKDERFNTYVKSLKKNTDIGLSFTKNITRFMKKNKKTINKETEKTVRESVWGER